MRKSAGSSYHVACPAPLGAESDCREDISQFYLWDWWHCSMGKTFSLPDIVCRMNGNFWVCLPLVLLNYFWQHLGHNGALWCWIELIASSISEFVSKYLDFSWTSIWFFYILLAYVYPTLPEWMPRLTFNFIRKNCSTGQYWSRGSRFITVPVYSNFKLGIRIPTYIFTIHTSVHNE